MNFFDPACGCGNFLIIAYRELRALEIELLRESHPKDQRVLDVAALSRLDVTQFYGIEISEFPARIAEVALWMMDHIMNNRLSLEFGEVYARIRSKPRLTFAVRTRWSWIGRAYLQPKIAPTFSGILRLSVRNNKARANANKFIPLRG